MKIGIQNCKNEKKSVAKFCHSDLLSVYKCDFAQVPLSRSNISK